MTKPNELTTEEKLKVLEDFITDTFRYDNNGDVCFKYVEDTDVSNCIKLEHLEYFKSLFPK